MRKVVHLHPKQIEIAINEAQIDYQMLLKDEELAKQMIQDSIQNMDGSQKSRNAIQKMKKKYTEIVLASDNKYKEITKLTNKLEVSISMHNSDNDLFESLEKTGATSMIHGYRQIVDKKKSIMQKAIAVEKIAEACIEVLSMEKSVARKTKKREKYANELLKLVDMTPEQRLIKARKDRAKLAKKAFGGVGIIASVGSFFFPPLAMVTVPLLTTGAIGYGASKTKYGKKLLAQTKEDTKLLKQSIEKFAYPEQAQIADNTQFNQGMGGQQYQDDIYGDMR